MKKRIIKRVISTSLACLMLSSTAVVSQTAGLLSITAAATTEAASEIIDSGSCGESASYTLDSEGVLTVSGSGMVQAGAFAGETYALADSVRSVVFAEGSEITDIGAYAFSGLTNLTSATIADTVGMISESAFAGCSALTTVEIDSATGGIADSAFGDCTALSTVTIASTFVKLHPDAFRNCPSLETLDFTAHDGTTIQGALYGLPETATVTMQPFSKIYTPAQKYLYGPSVAYDTYRPAYAHAILYWEDTEPILEAAAADGVSISDSKEKLEWITNDNISTYFTDAQCSIVGTMEGDGSFESPYLIWDAQNWRYLDYLGRLGKLAGSYYGWDRGTNVKLMADITLSDKDGTFTTIGGEKHKEVHNSGYAYVGNFDGNGHTITLDVNESYDDTVKGFGLFAKTDGAYIKNLHVSGRLVSSRVYTGLIIGKSSTDWIYNCSSDAELVLKGGGDRLSGSFVGNAYHTSLENCHFTGKILGGDDITGVGGFVGYMNGSNASGRTMKNCYFAPSEIGVSSTNSAMLYRPYYGSYSGWVGYETIENNFYNAEALKLNGENMGDLDQGMSDEEGIDALNETEFWENGEITMPQATVAANPGTRTFVYTGGEHRIFMDLQADGYNGGGSRLPRGSSFPYMPGYANNGIAYYKVNDGDWSATPPVATEVGEYTVYYCAVGDAYHSTSDIQSIEVSIVEPQELPGSGTAADPYTISNDLEWSIFCDMRDTKDKYFKLVNDIVVSENRQSKRGPQHPLEFNGNFDGDGHTITLYYVSRGTSDSLFGKLIGVWNYDTSSYDPVYIKNLTVDGVMYGSSGENSPIAYEITHNATVSNVINNMTIVHIGAGGDRAVSGIVNTGSLSGGVHFYNCKVNGKFSAMGGNKTFAGLTSMNDFWQSGTDFLVKDCYVDPTCEDINVSDGNYVIMGNYKEDKVTIENTFFGQNILGIIPVDAETGETTNTQGISDENGLDALYATGYWADGNPTMPKATITKKAPEKKTIVYTEQEPVYDEEAGEEIEQEPTKYPLLDEAVEAEGGTVWYSVNGGEWTTEIPTRTDIGMYFVSYKAVGDVLHRDSEEETTVVTVVPDWATPTGLTVSTLTIPYDDFGSLSGGENASVRVEWDDNHVNRCNVTVGVITPEGKSGILIQSAPVEKDAWYELGGEKPAARFFVGLLGENDEQVFADGRVNGVKYGDTVYVYATGTVNYEGYELESLPGKTVDFAAGASNTGKTFPVNEDGMSNDSGIKSDVIVLGDEAVIDCLASGGKVPYQFEVTYKKASVANYTTAQAYNTNSVVTFKPGAATVYDIHVNAKDAEGTVVGKDLQIDVRKVLANQSTISEQEIVLGESVIVSAQSEGGIEPREYQVSYQAEGSDEETIVQDYSANDHITVTPDKAGHFTVIVRVRDTRNVVVSKEFALTVNKPLANNSAISGDMILLGDRLTITADAEGGLNPIQYEIAVKEQESQDYTILSAYSDEKTLTMVCDREGNFVIRVNAKDSRGTVVSKEMSFRVHNTLTNLSEISEEEIVLGESAAVTGKARGGKAPYTYAMCYKPTDAEEYTLFRDYSEQAEAVFTPATDGTYHILVLVRDALGIVADKELTVKVNQKLTNLSTLSSKKIIAGNTITVNAAAKGGIGSYQYKVNIKKTSESVYSVVQEYSDNNIVPVKPAEAGEYQVRVAVRDERGMVTVRIFTVYVYSLLENKTEISAEEMILGEKITVSANAEGGKGPYQYEVTYKKSSSTKYSTVQSYDTNQMIIVTPTSAVSYDIHVNVRDAMGQVIGKDFTVTVYKPLENHSVLSASEITKGDTVTVTGTVKGGKAPYQYQVSYKKASSEKYTVLQPYDSNDSVKVTPGSATAYQIRIEAKDALGQTAVKELTVEVYPSPEVSVVLSESSILSGSSVTVTASAAKGKAPYQYEFLYKKAASEKYATAQKYSESNTAVIVPGGTGVYDIRVNARDALGKIATGHLTINVYNKLKNTSTISSDCVLKTKSVTVNCASTGGVGQKQYKVSYYDPSTKKWIRAKDFSTEAAVTLTPMTSGDYIIRTWVRDESGKTVSKDLALNVYGLLKNTSTVSSTTAKYGSTITVYCSATGVKGTALYDIKYYNSHTKAWHTVNSYAAISTADIKIIYPGKYTIRITCKDDRNTAFAKDIKVTVTVTS